MRYRILGDIEVVSGTRRLRLPGPREERALAAMLLGDGRPVPAHRMIDAVWGERPPAEAERRLHNVVYRLRRVLEAEQPGAVHRAAGGYCIAVAEGDLDAAVFAGAMDRAQREQAEGCRSQAAETLREALALWRGPALDGLDTPVLQAAATGWNERRVATQVAYAAHLLALARHERAVPELTRLLELHPMREDLAVLLITALYRCGRQTDALSVYAATRALLVRDAGVEPGPALREVHRRVLANDPGLSVPADPAPVTSAQSGETVAPAGRRPFHLPPAVSGFVARQVELDRLDHVAAPTHAESSPIVLITGLGGVGKSALAVRWARRNAARFPDGVLMRDLRGFDPSEKPVDPSEVLEGFLRALGTAAEAIPAGLDERSALLRTALSGRRVLIILDDADSAEHVRPLLAGAPGCPTVVTSRRSLAGLVARDGAVRIPLGPLPRADSRNLIAASVGAGRLDAEPEPTEMLLHCCGGLPLALRVAGEHLAAQPQARIAAFAEHLTTSTATLDFLSIEADQPSDLRAIFEWSYRALTPEHAAVLRFVAALAGVDVTAPATAALCGFAPERAAELLVDLADFHLLVRTGRERFGLHGLVRAFAAERAQQVDAPEARGAAVGRLVAWYTQTAAAADQLLMPQRKTVEPGPAPANCEPIELSDYADAMAWCESETANFSTVQRAAIEHGHHDSAWHLAALLFGYFITTKLWTEWQVACDLGMQAAEDAESLDGRARMLSGLGMIYGDTGRLDRSMECFKEVASLHRALGDHNGEAAALANVSAVLHRLGDFAGAITVLEDTLAVRRSHGDTYGVALTLTNLGAACTELHRYDEGLAHLETAQEILLELDNKYALGMTLDTLGKHLQAMGRAEDALTHHRAALRIFQETGDDFNRAGTFHLMGMAFLGSGRIEDARRALLASLALFEQIGAAGVTEAEEVRHLLEPLLASAAVRTAAEPLRV